MCLPVSELCHSWVQVVSNCVCAVQAVSELCLSCAQVCKSCWQLQGRSLASSARYQLAPRAIQGQHHGRGCRAVWAGCLPRAGPGISGQGLGQPSVPILWGSEEPQHPLQPWPLALGQIPVLQIWPLLQRRVGNCETARLKCPSKHCNTNVGCISEVLDKALASETLDEFPGQVKGFLPNQGFSGLVHIKRKKNTFRKIECHGWLSQSFKIKL